MENSMDKMDLSAPEVRKRRQDSDGYLLSRASGNKSNKAG